MPASRFFDTGTLTVENPGFPCAVHTPKKWMLSVFRFPVERSPTLTDC
jgi:hypothetical protein